VLVLIKILSPNDSTCGRSVVLIVLVLDILVLLLVMVILGQLEVQVLVILINLQQTYAALECWFGASMATAANTDGCITVLQFQLTLQVDLVL
jgi:hypothetical protein